MKKKLLLFTNSYPYYKSAASEVSFLQNELLYLNNFFQITLFPRQVFSNKEKVPDNIIVDESLANVLQKRTPLIKKFFNSIDFKYLLPELIRRPGILLNPKNLIQLLYSINTIKVFKRWFESSNYYHEKNKLIYTYWFSSITNCFALNFNHNTILTRVHGIDLFEERHNNYIPFRIPGIQRINKVFCASKAAQTYLTKKYPKFYKKYEIARLGVVQKVSEPLLKKNNTSCFILVSCSRIVEIKRTDLTLRGVLAFSKRFPNLKIKYIHFGGGPLFNKLVELKNTNDSDNLSIELTGQIANDEIVEFYEKNYVDAFITTSLSEGGCPVSIQEALSFGIPCIGTNVGGVPEMIDNNELLLRKDTSEQEIADALEYLHKIDPQETKEVREKSFRKFLQEFNAQKNFSSFATKISNY